MDPHHLLHHVTRCTMLEREARADHYRLRAALRNQQAPTPRLRALWRSIVTRNAERRNGKRTNPNLPGTPPVLRARIGTDHDTAIPERRPASRPHLASAAVTAQIDPTCGRCHQPLP
jgi:hypothetical protein